MKHAVPLAALGMLLPLAAQAQETAPADKARAAFAKVDTDKDGALSLAEWTAAGRRQRGFRMIDADKDGKLTPAELQAAMAKYKRGN
jgi:Ca2+-binding EF-hand superfamily protein